MSVKLNFVPWLWPPFQSDKLQEQQDLIEELHSLLAHPAMGLLQLTQRPHTAPINSIQQTSLGPGHFTSFCNGEAGAIPARHVDTSLCKKKKKNTDG